MRTIPSAKPGAKGQSSTAGMSATGKLTTLLDDPRGGIRDPQVSYDGAKDPPSLPQGRHGELPPLRDQRRRQRSAPVDHRVPMTTSSRLTCQQRHRLCLHPLQTMGQLLADAGRRACTAATPTGKTSGPFPATTSRTTRPGRLPDGRLLYTRWEYVDRSQVDYHHLWVANPDGSGADDLVRQSPPGRRHDRCQAHPRLGQGRGHFLARPRPARACRHSHGGRSQRGPDDASFARPISRRQPVSRSMGFLGGVFHGARRSASLVLLDRGGRQQEIFRLPEATSKRACTCTSRGRCRARPRELVLTERTDPDAEHRAG